MVRWLDTFSFLFLIEQTLHRSLLLSLLNSNEIPAFKMGKIRKIYKQNLIHYMSQYQ